MPNWCSNCMVLSGPKDQIRALDKRLNSYVKLKELSPEDENNQSWWADLEKADGRTKIAKSNRGHFLFGRALDYSDLGADVEMEVFGYNDAVSLMGTKWDPSFEVYMDQAGECLTINFQSAWAPPCRAAVLVGRKYNLDLKLSFEEGGCDFGGKVEYDADKDEVSIMQTGYLHWRWFEDHDDWASLDEYLEEEFSFLDDPEELNKIKKEAQGWKDAQPEVKGPFTAEDFLESERGWW